jgi:hypothetical protein
VRRERHTWLVAPSVGVYQECGSVAGGVPAPAERGDRCAAEADAAPGPAGASSPRDAGWRGRLVTAGFWLGVVVGGLALGPFSGLALFVLSARSLLRRAYPVWAARARVESGPRAAMVDGFNRAETRRRRKRSPNDQFVTTDFPPFVPRPGFYDSTPR